MYMKFELCVTRNSNGKVMLSVQDDLSGVHFLELELTLEQFALAITGMHVDGIDGKVRGLQNVGKKKVREPRSVTIEYRGDYDRDYLEKYLEDNCQEDGWILNSSLNSRGSIKCGELVTLNYSVYKYVEV